MNKKVISGLLVLVMILSLTGCTSKALDAANQAVDAYNAEANRFNEKVESYNSKVDEIDSVVASLTDAIDKAQNSIDSDDSPFDESTLTALENAIATASDANITVPDKIDTVEAMSVNEEAKKDELESLTNKANEETEKLQTYAFPDDPEVPDYSSELAGLEDALADYENSVQAMKQLTAPSDDFVMERLERVDTITKMAPVTEDHDPNNRLGKQGGYIGCIYFRDSQVDQSTLSVNCDREDVVDVGTQGGGAVEIFNTTEEAEARNMYIANFDGTFIDPGSHYVYGTVLIRTSEKLTGSQQQELTEKILNALIQVD